MLTAESTTKSEEFDHAYSEDQWSVITRKKSRNVA